MARPKTFTEIEEATSFFPEGSSKMVQRLIARATKKEIAANRRAMKAAVGGSRGAQKFGQAASRLVARELSKALKQRGASKRQAPSVKQKAPDTGGRPFHFAHSAISKTAPSGARPGGTAGGGTAMASTGGTSASGGKPKATTKSAAHMRYIERETAVEVTRGAEGPSVDEAIEAALTAERGEGRERGNTPGMEEAGRSPGAGQGYIENPVKLANGENVIFSFGTIGDTFDERVSFWETLEEHERNEEGRVQDRLIVELPHEATPTARYDMVKAFCRQFEERGFPYWAALHAPGEDNDNRNFHAHIVYSTRPAKRMLDPADGVEKWDFAIVETYKTSSRNTKTKHPHRQKRSLEMKRSDAIPKLRRAFAEVVNEVLVRDDVKDRTGEPVRYDARSYKAMGLDVVPMRSINRIVADKLKSGKLTVLDGDYTRKMIEAELREARGRRDRRLSELDKLGRAIDRLGRDPKDKETKRNLPREMWPSPLAKLGKKVVAKAGEQVLKARYAAYVHDVMEQSSRSTIDRIVEATDPKVLRESAKATKDPVKRAALPDLALAAALHAEAVEMRDRFERDNAKERERLRLRVGQALNRWSKAVAPPAPEASAGVKRERRKIMSLGDAERALRSARASATREAGQTRGGAQSSRTSETPASEPKTNDRHRADGSRQTTGTEPVDASRGRAPKGEAVDARRATTKREIDAAEQNAKPSETASSQRVETKGPATATAKDPTGAGSRTPIAGRKLSEREKADVRRRFDVATSGIMKAMRSLRSIPDVEKRMAAMDALAKAPLGPIDPSIRRAADAAWSAIDGSTRAATTRGSGTPSITDVEKGAERQSGERGAQREKISSTGGNTERKPRSETPKGGSEVEARVSKNGEIETPMTRGAEGGAVPPIGKSVGSEKSTKRESKQLSLNLKASEARPRSSPDVVSQRDRPPATRNGSDVTVGEVGTQGAPAGDGMSGIAPGDAAARRGAISLPTAREIAAARGATEVGEIANTPPTTSVAERAESMPKGEGARSTDAGVPEGTQGEVARKLTPEEELEAKRQARAEREKKRRKALLSKGKGRGGRGR